MESVLRSDLLRSKLLASERLFHPGEPVFIAHNSDHPTPAREFLVQAGAPDELIDRAFFRDGRLNTISPAEQVVDNPYDLEVDELFSFLNERLKPFFDLINYSLDQSANHGFNRHGSEHIYAVANLTVELLRKAGYDEQTVKRGLVAAMGHDIGNLLNRDNHEVLSALMMAEIFPELTQDTAQWNIVEDAIILHNEPALKLLLSENDITLANGQADAQQRVAFLRDFLPAEVKALFIADKVQVGRGRATKKDVDPSALTEDLHLLVNLMMETTQVGLSEDRKSFIWSLDFTPGIAEEQEGMMRFARSTNGSRKILVPEPIHRLHRGIRVGGRELSISHSYAISSAFFSLYFNRLILTVENIFALFPDVETVSIQIHDRVSGTTRSGGVITEIIAREEINKAIDQLRIKYLPKSERKNGSG